MRFIRLLFILALAVVLVAVALANRGLVTVQAFPAGLDRYLGFDWQLTLPLFMVIFAAIALGIVVGFIWEWLREAHIRSESKRRKDEVHMLEREVDQLRTQHSTPNDDVLAILDQPKASETRADMKNNTAALPAPR